MCVYIYIYVCVCVYIYIMEYYSAEKMNEILPFVATYMDLEGIMLSNVNPTEKVKYYAIPLLCTL